MKDGFRVVVLPEQLIEWNGRVFETRSRFGLDQAEVSLECAGLLMN